MKKRVTVIVPTPLYNYRIVEDGSFGNQNKNVNPRYDTIAAFFIMYDYLIKKNLNRHIKFLFESYFVNFIRHYAHITGKPRLYILNRVSEYLKQRNIQPGSVPSLSKEIKQILDKSYQI